MKTVMSVLPSFTSILGRISSTSRTQASLKGMSWGGSRWSGHRGRQSYTEDGSFGQNEDGKNWGRGNWRGARWKDHRGRRYYSGTGDSEGGERFHQQQRKYNEDSARSKAKKERQEVGKEVKTDRLIEEKDRVSLGQHDAEDKIRSNSPREKKLSHIVNKQNELLKFPGSYTKENKWEDVSSGVDGLKNLQECILPLPTFTELVENAKNTDVNGEQTEYPDSFPNAARCKKIKDFIVDFRSRSTCTKQELLYLMGYINFITSLMYSDQKFKSYLSSLSSLEMDSEGHVQITEEIREDICMWLYIISVWNGGSFVNNSLEITSDALNLHTDASSIGYGGYFQGYWFSEQWESECNQWVSSIDPRISVAFREMYPIVVSALLWGHLWKRKRIVFMCDNIKTIQLLSGNKTAYKHISPLVRQLKVLAAKHNFIFMSAYVPGRINSVADSLSRMQMDRFRKYAPDAQKLPCTVPCLSEVFWNSSMIIWEK